MPPTATPGTFVDTNVLLHAISQVRSKDPGRVLSFPVLEG